jgi:hypothetical protein
MQLKKCQSQTDLTSDNIENNGAIVDDDGWTQNTGDKEVAEWLMC